MSDLGSSSGKRYHDRDWLFEKYHQEMMDLEEIADLCGAGKTTIFDWMERHGIERRSKSLALQNDYATFTHDTDGHEMWRSDSRETDGQLWVAVHRLLAVAEFGTDVVDSMVVHHRNGIPWDNRPDNIELLTDSAHKSLHAKQRVTDAQGRFQ